MADDLTKKFETAAKDVKKLTKRPDDEDMLRLYALYKQGYRGRRARASGPAPSRSSIAPSTTPGPSSRAPTPRKAMETYVKLVERLKKTYG